MRCFEIDWVSNLDQSAGSNIDRSEKICGTSLSIRDRNAGNNSSTPTISLTDRRAITTVHLLCVTVWVRHLGLVSNIYFCFITFPKK